MKRGPKPRKKVEFKNASGYKDTTSKTSQKERVYRHFILNPLDYIQRMIIEPYNAANNTAYEITEQQKDGIEAVRKIVTAKLKKHGKQPMTKQEQEDSKKLGVSIMAGKGTGKDSFVSWIMMWFIDCFPYPKIPCTSVSAHQLNTVLWSEIAKWYSTWGARNTFTLQNEKFFRNDLEKDIAGKRWFAFPKTANPKSSVQEQTETLAGFHEDYVLVIADEAAGIPEPVFDPLEGTLTGRCNFMILIFNPTRSKGYAIDSQYKNAEHWLTLRWNSEESPIASKANIERIKAQYGMDSTPYRVRVLGLPPIVDEQTLIPMDWLLDAIDRDIQPFEKDPIIKSLDCGAGGDKSVMVTRKGCKIYPLKRISTPDSQVLINWAQADFQADGADILRVDNVGIGWGVYGGLHDRIGSRVESADSRKQASNTDKYFNKRAEMFWTVREKFEKGLISIPDDPDLIDSLSAIKATYDKGKIQIISTKQIRKELGHSPDDAASVALSYYYDDDIIFKSKANQGRYCHQDSGLKNPLKEGWLRS